MGDPDSSINPQSINLADPASVNWLLAQLGGRIDRDFNADLPGLATFSTDGGEVVNLNTPQSFTDNFGYTFETLLDPTTVITAEVDDSGSPTFQTPRGLVLYSNRQVDLNLWTSVGRTTNGHVWYGVDRPTYTETLSLPPLPETTDLIVTGVVIDNNDDARPAVLAASAGGVDASVSTIGPGPEGALLNIYTLTLSGVPAGTDEVIITLHSPADQNGDSAALIGVNASYICDSDQDNDTILNNVDGDGDPDGDRVPNYLDVESDGDQLLDEVEWNSDANGDGLIEALDRDADGDGVPNFLDLDSDNDGLSDEAEGLADANGNGILDFLEPVDGAAGGDKTIYLPIITK
jgi:hypothetical protein